MPVIFPVLLDKLVNEPEFGVTFPIALGDENVFPFKNEEFKFGITVLLATTKGAVPFDTVLIKVPESVRLVPVATPILGVIKVGLV
jgi:hypothetical protein